MRSGYFSLLADCRLLCEVTFQLFLLSDQHIALMLRDHMRPLDSERLSILLSRLLISTKKRPDFFLKWEKQTT